MKVFQRGSELLSGHNLILKFTEGHNYVKTVGRVMLPFSAHHLLMLYICVKFNKKISQVSELLSGHDLQWKFTKGHYSV